MRNSISQRADSLVSQIYDATKGINTSQNGSYVVNVASLTVMLAAPPKGIDGTTIRIIARQATTVKVQSGTGVWSNTGTAIAANAIVDYTYVAAIGLWVSSAAGSVRIVP